MRDKQIAEMARIVSNALYEWANEPNEEDFCPVYVAKAIYREGYRKASEVAVEIIDDLEEKLDYLDTYGYTEEGCDACVTFEDVRRLFEQLKKKYLGEDINAPTKESEGERNE